MRKLLCKHCGGGVNMGEKTCSHCGIPLPSHLGKTPQQKFNWFFIALVIFCVLMILWLPPDWSRFLQR
jgi:predicted nucleic acid-binding Zn ribbon protein